MKDLTQEYIKSILNYDPETGVLTWKNRVKVGKEVGGISHGYRRLGVDGVRYLAHRIIWLWNYGYLPENEIDHINRIKDDNRLINLREVSRQCNQRNRGPNKNNTSGVKGVYWSKQRNKYIAQIKINNKKYHLGYHRELDTAALHRLAAERFLKWHGCDSNSPAYLYCREHDLLGKKIVRKLRKRVRLIFSDK